MGTFAGVLLGAYLAYEFNRKKQQQDERRQDIKAYLNECTLFYNEFMDSCIDLINIHASTLRGINKSINKESIDRGLCIPYMPSFKLKELRGVVHRCCILDDKFSRELFDAVYFYNNFVGTFYEVMEMIQEFNRDHLNSLGKMNEKGEVDFSSDLIGKNKLGKQLHSMNEFINNLEDSFRIINISKRFYEKLNEEFDRYGLEFPEHNSIIKPKIGLDRKVSLFNDDDTEYDKINKISQHEYQEQFKRLNLKNKTYEFKFKPEGYEI